MSVQIGRVVCEDCGGELAVRIGPLVSAVGKTISSLMVERCSCIGGSFRIGDRVQVRAEHDELRLLGARTPPATVADVHSTGIVTVLEDGQAVPYQPHELERA